MEVSTSLLQRNRSYGYLLKCEFPVAAGARMPCADYRDSNVRNGHYGGYTCRVEITDVLFHNFKGELIRTVLNYLGSYRDSRLSHLSALIYPNLSDELTPSGFAVLSNSAIVTKNTNGKIVR